jgi:hypothetical protein
VSLSVLQLTPRDMHRARAMLKEQAGLPETDPYDIIDQTGDPDLRRVLVIWCVRSRTDPEFTWDQAWETPLEAMYPEDAEAEAAGEDESPPPTPGPENAGTEPGTNNGAGSKRKRAAAEPVSS